MNPIHILLPSVDSYDFTQLIIFIGSMSTMEGRNTAKIREKYSDMYIPVLLANWKVWPLAQVGSSGWLSCIAH